MIEYKCRLKLLPTPAHQNRRTAPEVDKGPNCHHRPADLLAKSQQSKREIPNGMESLKNPPIRPGRPQINVSNRQSSAIQNHL
jgi:hypothetical protein